MNEKSIIIIGAGIAGLSTGCYGQMNGYRTQMNMLAMNITIVDKYYFDLYPGRT